MKDNIQKRVVSVIEKVTKKKINHFNLKGNVKDQLSLDSIQMVELFAEMENEFNVELPLELMTVKTADEFLTMLKKSLDEIPQQQH